MQMAGKSPNPSPPDSGWRSGGESDSTFSFIFRVAIDRSSGSGPSRPLFRLEDVTAGREWHFTDYESAAEFLALRVKGIICGPDPG